MEGRIPIDPKNIKIYDREGKDIFERFPRPGIAYEMLVGDENIMMFCAATIRSFGNYVLLIWSIELT